MTLSKRDTSLNDLPLWEYVRNFFHTPRENLFSLYLGSLFLPTAKSVIINIFSWKQKEQRETEWAKASCGEKVATSPSPWLKTEYHNYLIVIHHIFSFLPTIYIVWMSLLSKHWTWCGFQHCFYFRRLQGCYFPQDDWQRSYVLKGLDNCMERCRLYFQIPDMFVASFKIDMPYDFGRCSTLLLKNWMVG